MVYMKNRWDIQALFKDKPHLKALNPQFEKRPAPKPLELKNPPQVPQEPKLGHSSLPIVFTIEGDPVPKPRMTRSDKWKKRPCVMRYREWADRARDSLPKGVDLSNIGEVRFVAYIGFFKCYSKKKIEGLRGMPHLMRPDVDNLGKAIFDSLFTEDCGIWKIQGEKRWDDSAGARIDVELR